MLFSCAGQTRKIQSTLKWEDNVDSAIVKARESNKLILLYFYAKNCDWCEAENIIINDKSVGKSLNNKFILVQINVEKSELARSTKIITVPTIIILYPTQNSIDAIGSSVGYLDKDQFKQFVNDSVKKSNSLKGELHL